MELTESVESAVAGMDWLKPTDRAAVDLALTYAARIDEALATGEGQEVTKALYLGPHLLNTLRALGGTPAERAVLASDKAPEGKLAQLRAITGGVNGEKKRRPPRKRKAEDIHSAAAAADA